MQSQNACPSHFQKMFQQLVLLLHQLNINGTVIKEESINKQKTFL